MKCIPAKIYEGNWQKQGLEAIQSSFRSGATSMDSVKEIAQKLRKLHSVDPLNPVVSTDHKPPVVWPV